MMTKAFTWLTLPLTWDPSWKVLSKSPSSSARPARNRMRLATPTRTNKTNNRKEINNRTEKNSNKKENKRKVKGRKVPKAKVNAVLLTKPLSTTTTKDTLSSTVTPAMPRAASKKTNNNRTTKTTPTTKSPMKLSKNGFRVCWNVLTPKSLDPPEKTTFTLVSCVMKTEPALSPPSSLTTLALFTPACTRTETLFREPTTTKSCMRPLMPSLLLSSTP
mmetsp:Transcript_11949/g.24259  ORF Transcript_11949/g.24259 Transcript_11949/m.24259 type:complete len:218 (-) Transcript_11949:669-1322(-)